MPDTAAGQQQRSGGQTGRKREAGYQTPLPNPATMCPGAGHTYKLVTPKPPPQQQNNAALKRRNSLKQLSIPWMGITNPQHSEVPMLLHPTGQCSKLGGPLLGRNDIN